ncbi:MAG: hypothetical protein QG567_1044 [Campylobacterota bacterium]|nr:hypothetical protein [Campylobacterota bacterium]
MAVVMFPIDNFYRFMEREIARILRYDTQKKEKISIVFLKAPEDIRDSIINVLKNNLRKSDVMFEDDGYIFLVLSNTGRMGSLQIDEIMKEFFSRNIDCSIASYPEDGDTLEELLEILKKITEDEYGINIDKYLTQTV